MAIFNSYVKLPEGTIAAKKSSWKPGIDDIYHIFTNKKPYLYWIHRNHMAVKDMINQ